MNKIVKLSFISFFLFNINNIYADIKIEHNENPQSVEQENIKQDKNSQPIQDELRFKDLEMGLTLIESIPDSALTSEEEFNKWKSQNPDLIEKLQAANINLRASFWACSWELGLAALALTPAGALARLKQLITGLGGARKVAEIIRTANYSSKALKAAGGELRDLAFLIIGITSIREACFDD